MNTNQKIVVGVLAAIAWIGAIVAAHAYPDMAAAMGEIKMGAQSVLTGLGVYHLTVAKPDSPNA